MSCTTLGLLCALVLPAAAPQDAAGPNPSAKAAATEDRAVAIRGGKVVWNAEADQPIHHPGTVVMRGGKIVAVGPVATTTIPEGATIVDATDQWVVPGILELHNHTGAGSHGGDLHDYVYLTNPDLRTLDAVQPECEEMKDALAAGVTGVLTIPGSGNNMSGFGTFMKTGGLPFEEAIIRFPGSLKIAQAGNPEGYMAGVAQALMNWSTRDQMTRGRDYTARMKGLGPEERRKSPHFNPQLELMIPLFEREVPISVHTQQNQVEASTIRILNRSLKLDAFVDHGTFDGYENSPEVLEFGVMGALGPRGIYRDPAENRIRGIMAEYWDRGVRSMGTNTDSPVVPQQELPYQATMGVRYGYPDTRNALRGLTILAARIMKVEERLGSLEPGKDADVVIWTGDPIDPRSRVLRAYVNGRLRYDEAAEGMRH